MKNIHILPTDKPSRLYLGNNGNFVFGMMKTSIQSINDDFTNQNIYITSDEEIKKGCWVYSEARKTLFKVKSICNTSAGYLLIEDDVIMPLEINEVDCKKIILTTDQDLIKDGVQAIDDEFLKWFVKNPNCEEVETYSLGVKNQLTGESGHYKYEIIIPKEEPKLTNVCIKCGVDLYYADNFTCQEHPKNCKGIHLSEETLKERALEEKPKQDALNHFLSTSSVIVKDLQISNFNKQETLEEVAERIGNNFEDSTFKAGVIYGVIEGAKWQQERSYSEEEVKEILVKCTWILTESKLKWFKQFKKK